MSGNQLIHGKPTCFANVHIMHYKMGFYLWVLCADEDELSVPRFIFALTHLSPRVDLQEDTPVKKPVIEEHGADLYEDLYDDPSVSTITEGPNVTDYEVG